MSKKIIDKTKTLKSRIILKRHIIYTFASYNDFAPASLNIDKILQWVYDDDIDDYVEKLDDFSDNNLYIINYRLIINLFMLFINRNTTINYFLRKSAKDKLLKLFEDGKNPIFEKYLSKFNELDPSYNHRNEIILNLKGKDTDEFYKDISEQILFIPIYIQELFKYLRKDVKKLKFILEITKKSINDFIFNYNFSLISFKSFLEISKYNNPKTYDLYLYRGFQYFRYKPLIDLIDNSSSDEFELPCILSSTIYEHIAINFLSGQRKIIWKIKVPNNKFDKFKYSFSLLNKPGIIQKINLTYIDKSIISESEFILNFGIKLKLINKRSILRLLPRKTEEELIELYEFEFIDYNTSSKLLTDFNKYIDSIINKLNYLLSV